MIAIRGQKWNEGVTVALAGLSAFCVYTCMYAFRKPFTTAAFNEYTSLGIGYKVWLVMAQTVGYTASKFFGIAFIGNLKGKKRAQRILLLIGLSWIALVLFATIPPPYNIIFLLINGFPLGMVYGLVFSYLEGRRSTEVLGAMLATSFIFASGLSQSAGKYVLLHWHTGEWWMPAVTGLLFVPPLLLFTWLLQRTPAPAAVDISARTARQPMSREERARFIKTFLPGLFLLILLYVMLTIIRDYRSNFAADIWTELGYGNDAAVFTKSELPSSIVVLVLMSLLVYVRRNFAAFILNHLIIIAGLLVTAGSTLLFINNWLQPLWWMIWTGVGLYMAYVPFNCMLFERLIASFKYVSNAGFIIYVADSFGYLGSDLVLVIKNVIKLNLSWTLFFTNMILVMSVTGIVLTILSAVYFTRKYRSYFSISTPQLNYG